MLPLLPLTTTAQSSEMRGTSTIQQIKNIKKQTTVKDYKQFATRKKKKQSFSGEVFLNAIRTV